MPASPAVEIDEQRLLGHAWHCATQARNQTRQMFLSELANIRGGRTPVLHESAQRPGVGALRDRWLGAMWGSIPVDSIIWLARSFSSGVTPYSTGDP